MDTIITIGGTAYDAAARGVAGFLALEELTLNLEGAPDAVSWTMAGGGPVPLFGVGMEVIVNCDGADVFKGDIVSIGHRETAQGWGIGYQAMGSKQRADKTTLIATGGGGTARYNLTPSDPDYLATEAGLTVGQIVALILKVPANATRLDARGVGAYLSLTPPTLPVPTLSDLAMLDIVPPRPVALAGESILAALAQFVQHWHPNFGMRVEVDGTIRFRDLFAMTAHALVIPGESHTVAADPVGWPSANRDTSGCYTRVEVWGLDIRPAILSLLDGTLASAYNAVGPPAWTITDFTEPKDATDTGSLSSLTPSTCTVTSDDATHHWGANFWNDSSRAGWIQLFYPAGTGIALFETRKITTTGALSAGGSCTIGWDAGDPITSLSYTKYRIVGRSGPLFDVGRLFWIREPVGPLLGLNTFVGANLVPRFPFPVPWRNTAAAVDTLTPRGVACWSQSGSPPYIEIEFPVELVRESGQIRAAYPLATLFSSPDQLAKGYPTTAANGLPSDVKVIVPYNRGDMVVSAPSSGHTGTAYTADGITDVLVLAIDDWRYAGDTANMARLCAAHLKTVQDAVVTGSILHHGMPAGFDALTMGYALNLSVAGAASPWDGVNLPVRSVTVRWPQGTGDQHECIFAFSNLKRPFQGDDLYIHPIDGGGASFGGQMPFGQSDFMGPIAMGEGATMGGATPGGFDGGFDLGSGLGPDPAVFRQSDASKRGEEARQSRALVDADRRQRVAAVRAAGATGGEGDDGPTATPGSGLDMAMKLGEQGRPNKVQEQAEMAPNDMAMRGDQPIHPEPPIQVDDSPTKLASEGE